MGFLSFLESRTHLITEWERNPLPTKQPTLQINFCKHIQGIHALTYSHSPCPSITLQKGWSNGNPKTWARWKWGICGEYIDVTVQCLSCTLTDRGLQFLLLLKFPKLIFGSAKLLLLWSEVSTRYWVLVSSFKNLTWKLAKKCELISKKTILFNILLCKVKKTREMCALSFMNCRLKPPVLYRYLRHFMIENT